MGAELGRVRYQTCCRPAAITAGTRQARGRAQRRLISCVGPGNFARTCTPVRPRSRRSGWTGEEAFPGRESVRNVTAATFPAQRTCEKKLSRWTSRATCRVYCLIKVTPNSTMKPKCENSHPIVPYHHATINSSAPNIDRIISADLLQPASNLLRSYLTLLVVFFPSRPCQGYP
jgi:hypothetical protein